MLCAVAESLLTQSHFLLFVVDPASVTLGYPPPPIEGIYDPSSDPEATTPDQVFDVLQPWVSSYFKHSDIATGHPAGLSREKFTDKQTTSQWTEAQMAQCFDKQAAIRSRMCVRYNSKYILTFIPDSSPAMGETLRAQTHRALFDGDLVASYFPNVNVVYMTGEETIPACMWAYMQSVRLYTEAIGRGEHVRPTTFKLVPEGNHFVGGFF